MKIQISELLDGYVDEEFSTDAPLSASRIKELTMGKIGKKHAGRRRFSARVLLVAVIGAALLCGSALAIAYALGAGDWFQEYFTRADAPLSNAQVAVIDQIGTTSDDARNPLPAPVTSNGATITPVAALADENMYYLRLRVEAPAGVFLPDLGEGEGYYHLSAPSEGQSIHLICPDGSYESFGYSLSTDVLSDADPADNVKDFVLRFTARGSADMAFNDGVSKLLTIHGLWVQGEDKEYTPLFTGEFSFDIGLSFESRTVELDCAGLSRSYTIPFYEYTYTDTLHSLVLSPLSLSYSFTTDLVHNSVVESSLSRMNVKIVLKDGTVFYGRDYGRKTAIEKKAEDTEDTFFQDFAEVGLIVPPPGETYVWEGDGVWEGPDGPIPDDGVRTGFLEFDQPLDLDQVDYVQYGDHKIPVDP